MNRLRIFYSICERRFICKTVVSVINTGVSCIAVLNTTAVNVVVAAAEILYDRAVMVGAAINERPYSTTEHGDSERQRC